MTGASKSREVRYTTELRMNGELTLKAFTDNYYSSAIRGTDREYGQS